MRTKLILALAAIVALAVAATALAGPYNELEKGKDHWYLIVNKAGDRVGYVHETYARVDFEGHKALKMWRFTMDKVANKTEEIEWYRELNQPLLSLTVKLNSVPYVSAKPAADGWEFVRNGQKQPIIQKGHFEFFSCDDYGIYGAAEQAAAGDAKKLRIYDVVAAARFERAYKNLGTKDTTVAGQKFASDEFDIAEGAKITKVHVAKDTLTLLDSRVQGEDTSTKRTTAEEVKQYFPSAQ